ncbi:MAG TPA: twin-arginine translocase TatA/TatE family subunit [Anaerolineae bacterium]
MWGLQPLHLVLILIIALVIFGPARLPELGKSLGKSITEFKNATREMTDPVRQAADSATEQRSDPAAKAEQPVDQAQK